MVGTPPPGELPGCLRKKMIFSNLVEGQICWENDKYKDVSREYLVLNDLYRTRLSHRFISFLSPVSNFSQSSCVSPVELTSGRGAWSRRKPGPL
jgi:hypothetical protein